LQEDLQRALSDDTEQLYREIAPTFLEDKEMVEAQQSRLECGFRGKSPANPG